ncbi:putative quinone oxidoreductase [Tieghemostelium lacteum]|uniref:Probable quinone oxidoreductase n=1 Tax=Tieghemostelium lacteum TaxID=361077 RepID=A0A151ZBB5_TIELA|nr:putative quinone oxidoreductase [Tieghemostelium lacteum]|eukprot:KYQ91174.1 putative quinone oxidoreductase [Tieghemostelium lacteum]
MKAIRVSQVGGVEQLKYDTIPVPQVSKENEVLIKNQYSGINFIDIYHRTGLYKLETPFTLGREGSGIVESVGSQVKSVKAGDRVCYFSPNSYAQFTLAPEGSCFRLPDNVDFQSGAAYTLQGLTGHYLIRSTFPLNNTHYCLIQAGAGGLGQILIQMAKIVGAKVITTVSSKEKEEICRSLGADHIINYTETPDFASIVKSFTPGGKGVDVVYDGVGLSTWMQSLKSLKPLGYLALVGNASGPVPPIDPLLLSANGSLFVTRPTLVDYLREPGSMQKRMEEIFSWVESKKLTLNNQIVLPLEKAGEAHTLLETRKSTVLNFIGFAFCQNENYTFTGKFTPDSLTIPKVNDISGDCVTILSRESGMYIVSYNITLKNVVGADITGIVLRGPAPEKQTSGALKLFLTRSGSPNEVITNTTYKTYGSTRILPNTLEFNYIPSILPTITSPDNKAPSKSNIYLILDTKTGGEDPVSRCQLYFVPSVVPEDSSHTQSSSDTTTPSPTQTSTPTPTQTNSEDNLGESGSGPATKTPTDPEDSGASLLETSTFFAILVLMLSIAL